MKWLSAIVALLVPGLAQALSCLPPNPARSVDGMFQGGRPYQLIVGTLVPTSGITEPTTAGETAARYRLTGARLMPDGDDRQIGADLLVRTSCTLSWCGRLPETGKTQLFFVSARKDRSFALRTSPCGGRVFDAPNPEQAEALRTCLRHRRCPAWAAELFERR